MERAARFETKKKEKKKCLSHIGEGQNCLNIEVFCFQENYYPGKKTEWKNVLVAALQSRELSASSLMSTNCFLGNKV